MEIRRTTAGQAGEISGMGRSDSLRIRSRAKPGEHFTGGRRLVHMVKAQLQKAVEDDVHIVQVLKLPIEGGVGVAMVYR